MLPLVDIFSKHGISFHCNADKKLFIQIRRYKCTECIHTAASSGASREQLGVQWLARGHLSCGYCRWKRVEESGVHSLSPPTISASTET